MDIQSQQSGFSSASLSLLQSRVPAAAPANRQASGNTSDQPVPAQRTGANNQFRGSPRGRLLDILV